jgi:4a-hydroxytetrahydrobiopterin dehydratase
MAYDKTLLGEPELKEFLSKHPDWRVEGKALVRTFELPSFRQAMAFVDRVAEIAEREDHHPDIDIRFRRVTLRLTTHDAGGLTFRDPRVAELADVAVADQVAT